MKKTRNVYYFDYSPEAINYIMSSKILRQSEKNILNDIFAGKTVKELAMFDKKDFVINYLDRTYTRFNDIYGKVGEISAFFPHNTVLITMNGHITCSKNGIIYDTFDCRNREAEYVWLVK